MGMGPRLKRIKRLRALFPVVEEMEEYAEQIRNDDIFTPSERPTSEDLWLPTPFSHNRDSELREECDWDVITEAFQEKCPDDYRENRFAHWGVGWTERIYVRRDSAAAIKLTQEFVNALGEGEPLDTARYSALESEKLNEYLSDQLSGYPGDDDDAYIERVRAYLYENHSVNTLDDVSQDMVKTARLNVRHPYEKWVWDSETLEEECFFCNQPESAACHDMTSIEAEAAGQMRLFVQP
jgi:hypothetical protein